MLRISADPSASLEETVAELYRTISAALTREPRVATAMLSDVLGNPHGIGARIFARYFPRARASVGGWLRTHVDAGRIRDIPISLLLQQLLGPMLAHVLMRPASAAEINLDSACAEFTAAFLRAAGTSKGPGSEGR